MSERLIEGVLGAGGAVSRALGAGYEPREEQLAMARAVSGAMEARSHLVVEAGTGVGKSFGYLVPAIHRCIARGETVLVSTHTIALQEQLVGKDVPMLAGLAEARPGDWAEDTEGRGRFGRCW